MDTLLKDLRLALRSLHRQPGFAALVVLTLALGAGANTGVFTMLRGLLLRPLLYVDSDRLVALSMRHETLDVESHDFSWPDLRDLAEQCTLCEAVAFYDERDVVLAEGDEAEFLLGQAVSAHLFDVLGVAPQLGRSFQAAEGERGQSVVLISDALWHRRLAGDPQVVGRKLVLEGTPFVVVGVLPPGFRFPERSDVWFPIPPEELSDRRSRRYLDRVVARLRPGVSLASAQAELDTIAERLGGAYPESNAGWSFGLHPFRQALAGDGARRVLALMFGAVAFVLLIACANVANLLLAREVSRRREMAIRLAMGASRWRLVRQILTESLVLALGGSALGVLHAAWSVEYLRTLYPDGFPYWLSVEMDVSVLVFTLVLTVTSALVFGIAPALRAARPALGGSLKDGSRGAGAGAERQRLQRTLVVAEVALAVVLVFGGVLMFGSLQALMRVEAGFETNHMLTMRVRLTGERFAQSAARAAFLDRAVRRLDTLPGVERSAASCAVPLAEDGANLPLVAEGQVSNDNERTFVTVLSSTAGFFETLGVPLLRGRTFSRAETTEPRTASGHPVAIVNQRLAERLWPGREAIGQRFRLGEGADAPWLTVIGIAPNLYYEEPGEETDSSRLQVHLPFPVMPFRTMAIFVRTAGEPGALAATVRREMASLDNTLPVFELFTMEEVRRRAVWGERLMGEVFAFFALAALLLAALGVYGVMAFAVSQRVPEIGIRMALGADRSDVGRMVLKDALVLVSAGLVLGLAGAVAVSRVLEALLFGVASTDPGVLVAVALPLAAAAMVASYLPARRAARVDPAVALRSE